MSTTPTNIRWRPSTSQLPPLFTPLSLSGVRRSVINDRTECLDALVEANVDPNVVFMGETALSIAARQNRDKIMKKLLNYAKTKKDTRNESGGTILHFAAAGTIIVLSSPPLIDLFDVRLPSPSRHGGQS